MSNRLNDDDEYWEQRRVMREQYRFAKLDYEPNNCIKCGRPRVGLRKNGKRICEKCYWDQDLNTIDLDAASFD